MSNPATALLDPLRLRVAGTLVDRPHTIAQLSTALEVDAAEVVQAVGQLRASGLVDALDTGYVLPASALRSLARALAPEPDPMDPRIGYGMTDDERAVLSRFFAGSRLTAIPSDRSKRLVVLQRLALEFDVGRRFEEPDVDTVLGAYHHDTASLRRALVDEDLLDREHDVEGRTWYWRSGGRVPT